MKQARSWNSSIGFQRQFGATMAVEMDYIYTKGTRREGHDRQRQPASTTRRRAPTIPFTNANRARLPWPDMGVVSMIPHNAQSELRSLQTAFTKRMSSRWQASATYTLSWFYNAENQPFQGLEIVPFEVQPDLGGEWGLARRRPASPRRVQRHLAGRARASS